MTCRGVSVALRDVPPPIKLGGGGGACHAVLPIIGVYYSFIPFLLMPGIPSAFCAFLWPILTLCGERVRKALGP